MMRLKKLVDDLEKQTSSVVFPADDEWAYGKFTEKLREVVEANFSYHGSLYWDAGAQSFYFELGFFGVPIGGAYGSHNVTVSLCPKNGMISEIENALIYVQDWKRACRALSLEHEKRRKGVKKEG